ncbi:hypothetical protein [Nostoc flagelliforme]|uniref:hypothetical protein n=1 Tax=Nostoc flagelliforme TaxID=1306274 RepID=UPI00168559E6|nr:hypothetical protein [Nostoc flagelliforme]
METALSQTSFLTVGDCLPSGYVIALRYWERRRRCGCCHLLGEMSRRFVLG